jgi:hypothetical protein
MVEMMMTADSLQLAAYGYGRIDALVYEVY